MFVLVEIYRMDLLLALMIWQMRNKIISKSIHFLQNPPQWSQWFSRIRTTQTLWTKHGHLCLWLPDNLLYHELEMDPGPSQKKPMCANCRKAFRKTKVAILCKDCPSYFHAKCSGLKKDAFSKLNTSTEQWLCLTCNLPQISDSFFESSSSISNLSDPGNCFDTSSSEIFETFSRHGAKHCVKGSLNINSLSGKFDEVQEWIEAFDILSIQETKIDRSFPDS